LNGKCNSDFSDIRFTASDGTTLLSYWIESYTVSGSATVWVKINDDLSTNPTTIYIYYGNPNATSLSNGDAVFNYFDQGDKFSTWTQGTYSCINDTSDGNPPPSYKAPSGRGYYMYKDIGLAPNMALIFNVKSTGLGNLFFLVDSSGKGQMYRLETRGGSNYSGFATTTSWTSWDYPRSGFYALVNEWYKLVIAITSPTSADLYYSQTTDRSPANFGTKLGTFTITNNGSIIGLVGDALGTSYYTWWDNIIVRKYVDPEPSHGSWGSEETSAIQISSSDSGSGIDSLTLREFETSDSQTFTESISYLDRQTIDTGIASDISNTTVYLSSSDSLIATQIPSDLINILVNIILFILAVMTIVETLQGVYYLGYS
jgi:hypothetical protein